MLRWVVAAIVVGQSCGPSRVSAPLSTGHLRGIQVEALVMIGRVAEFPPLVREALAQTFEDGARPLLDAGDSMARLRPWRTRRLVIGACGRDHCLVQYEHVEGGRGSYLLVLGLNPDNAQIEWSGKTRQRATTVADLTSVVLRAAAAR